MHIKIIRRSERTKSNRLIEAKRKSPQGNKQLILDNESNKSLPGSKVHRYSAHKNPRVHHN